MRHCACLVSVSGAPRLAQLIDSVISNEQYRQNRGTHRDHHRPQGHREQRPARQSAGRARPPRASHGRARRLGPPPARRHPAHLPRPAPPTPPQHLTPPSAPSLTNSQCWQERAVRTATGSISSPEDTQGRGRGHRGSTKAVGQHADKQACSSPTPALTPPPINRPPPGFGHSMLEEGIRLPRTRVRPVVQLFLRASLRTLTICTRHRGQ